MEVCATISESIVTESQNASEALQQIVIALEYFINESSNLDSLR